MKRALLGLLLLLTVPAWAASASERTLRIADTRIAPPLDPDDAAWARAPAAALRLYPQTTVPGGPGGEAVMLEARVLRGGGLLAVRLAWADADADSSDKHATHRFADAAAVQFAPAGKTLPYVGMGEPGRPVQVWFWRAGQPAERLSAQGFGSLTRQPGARLAAQARRTATGWTLVLRGKPEMRAPAAVAFAAWDGAEDGRAGRKRLSAWQALSGPDGVLPAALREEARLGGDPARGERLYAAHGCAACHAPEAGLGPDLAHAGGIHWPGHLRRAVREPAAFRVPGYAAIMPVPSLRPEQLDDLVAYLIGLR
ncbi:MAG: hypothetical protein B7X93_02255 [Hydrogenophilales bacterium 17-61-9]|nr:MAG: hypothetical protein B7X93_02255 [Hydrogenophilales bacterium 17-61-9]